LIDIGDADHGVKISHGLTFPESVAGCCGQFIAEPAEYNPLEQTLPPALPAGGFLRPVKAVFFRAAKSNSACPVHGLCRHDNFCDADLKTKSCKPLAAGRAAGAIL
jgi:hypothetical protein